MTSGWMRRTARTVAAAAAVGVLLAPTAVGWPAAATPLPPTPVTDHCPYRVGTPPAVDTSEVVAPGARTPTALPVPSPAVGGDRLAACGVVADPAAGPLPAGLTSAGWLIADLDNGRVVAAKDPHGRYRPASTIKLLLALVALRDLDLGSVVEPTVEDWSTEGDSCGMGPRGHYTVRDLITGLLMVSGNDCANALSRELGGHDVTLTKMNALANDLGAHDTRAATPSGLDAPGMSSSPYDLALIFRNAMGNSTFREMIALSTFRFPGYPARPDIPGDKPHPAYDMYTSNRLLLDGYPGALGGKTGYTDDARKTFVGAAQRNGRTVLIVQMYGLSVEGDMYWDQAKSMLEYGFGAPATTSVGALINPAAATSRPDTSPPTTPTTTAAPNAGHNTRTAGSGADHSTSMRVLVGLIAALAAVGLLIAGLRLFGRR
ncbi:serine hydrolase [Gordonia sp. ABSL1-1]|uniref:D-alanyl-D-alanine carboxypeptidase family protein n=1 Tax=Gordonia sp. ABSL1-1 TaxID=3053923 RepID=UPI0025730BEA|nr:serine hydrolase [Gordonia sp. ABSL1-1]MDL9937169.1 serine hydrolase [Gordonia sp. ABSL1-1]